MGETLFLLFSHSSCIFAEHLYIFSPLIFFISIYAIFNFYYNIFLLVPAEKGLKSIFWLRLFESYLNPYEETPLGHYIWHREGRSSLGKKNIKPQKYLPLFIFHETNTSCAGYANGATTANSI